MANNASRDGNNVATLMGVSTVDGKTPIPVKVDTSGNLQTSATLTGGGGDGAILDGVSSAIKATVLSLTNAKPLTTALVDGSGNQITSFGGGTQYVTASAQATPTGTVALGYDGANVRALLTDGTGILKTSIQNASLAVTGTFWQSTQPVSVADGSDVTLGAKADAASTATDITAISIMSVLKQISKMAQAPASTPVTNSGTFAVQATPVTQADTFMLGGVNVKEINGITPLMGAGNGGTGSLRVNIASDQVSIPVAATLNAETTKVIGTVNQGTSPWVASATLQTQTDTTMIGGVNVKEINGVTPLMGAGNGGTGSLRVNIATDQLAVPVSAPLATPVFATVTPSTTGGWSVKSLVALTNTKTAVKAGAGTFGGYMFYNPNASVVYIQVWNVAIGSITVGTTAPTFVIPIPATAGANVEFTNGINHSTEINVAATTTATGLTAPSTAVDGFVLFK